MQGMSWKLEAIGDCGEGQSRGPHNGVSTFLKSCSSNAPCRSLQLLVVKCRFRLPLKSDCEINKLADPKAMGRGTDLPQHPGGKQVYMARTTESMCRIRNASQRFLHAANDSAHPRPDRCGDFFGKPAHDLRDHGRAYSRRVADLGVCCTGHSAQ